MKPINMIMTISLTLTALVCAHGQTPGSGTQKRSQESQSAGAKLKVLVERLPEGIVGVTLENKENKAVRLKQGYKFVKKSNEVIVVALAPGAPGGVGGSWSCSCDPSSTGEERGVGSCSISISGPTMTCVKSSKNGCNTSCTLDVTADGYKTGVIRY